ncbi:MAG: CxxxxCH/CxxCH domain c-type cytochrome [Ignavibacteriaceae bacterium]
MKYFLINILLAFTFGIILASCSDLQNNIPTTPQLSAHKPGNLDPTSPNFHGNVVKANNWSMKDCQQCHAADYSGGTTGASCKSCHTSAKGPEACNTCHGNFSDTTYTFIAPPRDLNGDTSTTAVGVGAHFNHLYGDSLSSNVQCSSCHVVPQSVYSPGHINPGQPARVTLGDLATTNIASNAVYNYNGATCSNTYCHGNFVFSKDSAEAGDQFAFADSEMVGNNKTVTWNKVDGSQAACGSCHDLPPKGHIGPIPLTKCFTCHQGVVDDQGNIIDKAKHINGKVNVRGN